MSLSEWQTKWEWFSWRPIQRGASEFFGNRNSSKIKEKKVKAFHCTQNKSNQFGHFGRRQTRSYKLTDSEETKNKGNGNLFTCHCIWRYVFCKREENSKEMVFEKKGEIFHLRLFWRIWFACGASNRSQIAIYLFFGVDGMYMDPDRRGFSSLPWGVLQKKAYIKIYEVPRKGPRPL